MDDFEMLQSYAARKSEDAFRTLTDRYANLVYSAAARQTNNAETAKDVTQAVFLTLAKKAKTIPRDTVLAGWLLSTTRFAAANARRLEQRRQNYEQIAMQSYFQATGLEADWQCIAPLLDDALTTLVEKDRDALVLRFFEQMPLKKVAERLGTSEDGAHKRIRRSLDKLRGFFARHGRTVSIGSMAGVLTAHSIQAGPEALTASVCAAVVNSEIVTASFAAAITKATLGTIAQSRLRSLFIRVGSAATLIGAAALVVLHSDITSKHGTMAATMAVLAVPGLETPAPSAGPTFVAIRSSTAPPHDASELLLRIVDANTAAPVTNARLTLVSTTEFPQRATNVSMTDAEGLGRVAYSTLPVKLWSHRVEVFRDGYVPKYVSWSENQQDRMDEIPMDYTVRLDPATTIGGLVVDEQDAPVKDARVVFSVSGPVPTRARERLTMMGNYHSEMADADGRWSCTHVPARFGKIVFSLVHPLFQEQKWIPDSPDARLNNVDRIPEADFLAGRALMRLKPGLTIAGVVTDEHGQPVGGARVSQNFDFHRPEHSLLTSPDGSFQFRNGHSGNLSLTVQASSFAPVVTSLVFNANAENFHVTLPSGRALRGLVLDDAENPIAGATVEAASPSKDSRTLFQWRAQTDGDGRFAWDAAPTVQEYAVSASGFETQRRVQLTADSTIQTIHLPQVSAPLAARIYGQVVDAESKLPLPFARVQIWETSKGPSGGLANFTTVPEDVGPDGRFRLMTSEGTVSYYLEAQAAGYGPRRLTNQISSEREVKFQFELAKAPGAAGIKK